MVDLSNYYQREPVKNESTTSERYPRNHVKFSGLLKPLQWIDGAYGLFGSRAFMMMDAMLKEFDSAAPLDECLGTEEELKQIRNLIISFCEGVDNNPFLSSIGRFILKKSALGMLKNRKKVLQYYVSNKEFIESNGKFKAPLIITGSSRSGTTLLQRLLSEDPNTRSLYTYELETPIPPMDSQTNPMKDPRIQKSSAGIKTLSKLASGFLEKFAESHLWQATEMEESIVYALAHNGLVEMNCPSSGRVHVEDLLRIEDKRPIFRYERLFFTMLDVYRPAKTHWTLKGPDYAVYFPFIFDEYQDAKVIVTHRNPLITLPSLCRLWESWCIAFDRDGSFDKHQFAQLIRLIQKKYINVPLNYRRKHPEKEDQIFDCMYDDFFLDPIMMVKKVYQEFDLEYTEEFEKRMIVYLENNKQGKYGRHKYSLEEYGFDAESLYEEFSDYMELYGFGIPDKKERPASFDFLKNANSFSH
ncbi:sulfotransferase [Draconibacterium sp.]|nr:sulfotransferase [Draconibacterium sp.]